MNNKMEIIEKKLLRKVHKSTISDDYSEDEFIVIPEICFKHKPEFYFPLNEQHCHTNTVWLYKNLNQLERYNRKLKIMSGWALLKPENIWYQHSWLIVNNFRHPEIIETTVKFDVYYGKIVENYYKFFNSFSFHEENYHIC